MGDKRSAQIQMRGDWYYGEHAQGYEAKRKRNPLWQKEQDAVDALVSKGPVLDVPIGTGRYIPIYQRKGLDFVGVDISPDMIAEARKRAEFDFHVGSITDLPCQGFGTAVCTRLMNWLDAEDMHRGVSELHRVADECVIGIRFSPGPERMVNHSRGAFLDALSGAWITDSVDLGNDYHIFKSRFPTWADVNAQFQWQPKPAQLIADNWCERLGLDKLDLPSLPVRCEYVPGTEIWSWIESLSNHEVMRSISGEPRADGPVTALEIAGERVLLDGRHRAKKWRNSAVRRPVFVVSNE
jgi:SAM-dependent methyltransferase